MSSSSKYTPLFERYPHRAEENIERIFSGEFVVNDVLESNNLGEDQYNEFNAPYNFSDWIETEASNSHIHGVTNINLVVEKDEFGRQLSLQTSLEKVSDEYFENVFGEESVVDYHGVEMVQKPLEVSYNPEEKDRLPIKMRPDLFLGLITYREPPVESEEVVEKLESSTDADKKEIRAALKQALKPCIAASKIYRENKNLLIETSYGTPRYDRSSLV